MSKVSHFLSRLSLQHRFVFVTTFAIIGVMSIIGYLGVQREKKIFYAEVEKQGRLLGKTLAIPIINDLVYEKVGVVEEGGLLDNYTTEIFNRRDADLLYIAILDKEGRVVSHNDVTEYGKLYTDPVTRKSLETDDIVVQQISGPEHKALDFGVPLSIGKNRWGTLRFAIYLEKAEHELIATVKTIILLTIIFLMGGFAIILLLSRRFLRPIVRLATSMEKVRGDRLDFKVEVKGRDEFARLSWSFNNMIERIKNANEEVKRSHEKLVQSERLASLGILVAGVAHEINNPLCGLLNCLQTLRQSYDKPEMREKYLDLLKEGLSKIENTVRRLLWMSRKDEHVPVVLNVQSVTDRVYSLLEYEMKKGKILFVNETPGDLQVFLDMHDFQQILINLFINSIHAMKNGGGALRVRGYPVDSIVKIEVIDNGSGIQAEHLSRVFDPFFTTKPTAEGTGLGLWMVYEIIQSYRGDVSVESEVGKGSKFIISLPCIEQES